MKTPKLFKYLTLAAASLLGLTAAATAAAPATPIGNLTVTVEEQADGSSRFTLSGSTMAKNSGYVYQTPTDYADSLIPPANRDDYTSLPMPEGLAFVFDGTPKSVEYVRFASGGWYLEIYSGYVESGETVTGTGSVLAPDIAFSDFVPGTFPVVGYYFDITYVVAPYVMPAPSSPKLETFRKHRFSRTEVKSRSGVERFSVENVGDAPATGIRVRVSGRGSRHFRIYQPRGSTLQPGASTKFRARFNPKARGTHRVRVRITSSAPTETAKLVGRGVEMPVGTPRFPGTL